MIYDSKAIGDLSETVAKLAFQRAGLQVLQPIGDNCRYDFVVEVNKQFITIQCKTARVYEDKITFSACSTYNHRGRGKRSYKGEVDYFIAVAHEINKVYLLPVNQVGVNEVVLRLKPTVSGQVKNIKWAIDYEFNNWPGIIPVTKAHQEKIESFKINPQIELKCEICGEPTKTRTRCRKCATMSIRRVDRPSKELLQAQIIENGYCATARSFGVTDNAIRKWLK